MRAAGHLVLVTRPDEEELRGTMIGLLDLFDDVDADPAVLDPDTDLFDRGRAVLATLRRLTDADSVVLAIDDLQWLDPISVRSLRYALRRLEDRPLWVLATERTEPADGARLPLLSPERSEEIMLGVLPIESIRHVLAPVVTTISRPALELVHELSGGNPMYALELARSTDLNRDRLAASSRQTLDSTLSARLGATPPAIRRVVQTAAALGPASPERLQAASGEPDALERLADAIDRGLLTLDESMLVRCAHPLLGSVVLGAMEPDARRALHARLADAISAPDDRARHLALASVERDPTVSAELEEAANRAGRRGAPRLAAEFAAHSLRLTPIDDRSTLARRAVAEILHRAAAGETGRAIAMIDAIVAGLPPGPERFAALTLRVGIDFGSAEEVLAQAQEEAEADELVRGRILDLLGYMTYMYRGELDRARELEAEALAIARRHGDAELEMLASATLAVITLLRGDPHPELSDRALELGRQVQNPRLGRWPDVERARQCLWAGYLDEAREVFTGLQTMAARSGIEFQRPFRRLGHGVRRDRRGPADGGGRARRRRVGVGARFRQRLDGRVAPLPRWSRPRPPRRRRGARPQSIAEMRSWGSDHGEHTRVVMAHHVAGVLALAKGDGQAALDELLDGVTLGRRLGFAHPGVVAVLPDAIEAATTTGTACSRATWLTSSRPRRRRCISRGWMRLRAAGGHWRRWQQEPATRISSPTRRPRSTHSGTGSTRPERGGGTGGRCNGRVAAGGPPTCSPRPAIASPAIGAAPWAEQAAAELERVAPGRATGSLTEDEARIAALVAEGRRNREIAADLFVSVATVEAHLTAHLPQVGDPVPHRAVAPPARIIAIGTRDVGYVPQRDHAIAGVGPDPTLGS